MSDLPRYTAAIFDMDGLLLDTERPVRDAWLGVLSELGCNVSEADYLELVGQNHAASSARLRDWLGGDPARLDLARRRASARLAHARFDVKPGARRLLAALRSAGVPCAVATSTWRVDALARLSAAGLLDSFVTIGTGDEVEHGKPAPDLYRLVLQRLAVAPDVALVFEDSGHGVQAALAAGLAVVNVPDLKAPEPAWQARCLAVLPSLEAACPFLPEWFGVPCPG